MINRIENLNNGLVATTNLQECLQIDQSHLFTAVITPFYGESQVTRMLTEITATVGKAGILQRMKITGQVLAKTELKSATQGELTNFLSQHMADTVRGWACFMLPQSANRSLAQLLSDTRLYAKDDHFAVREWIWMALRDDLEAELTQAIAILTTWVTDPHPFIRRFAVECLRPRGVWCKHITALKQQPELALALLEPLRSEPESYVQDSVANWLNDASKTQPDWVSALCARWLAQSETKFTQRIVKRAMRTINKPK